MRTLSAVPRRAARPSRLSLGTAALLVLVATACEDVTVTPVAVRSVAVTPTDTTLVVGEALELTALVTDDTGNRLTDRSVTWSTENNEIVSVDASGEVVAVGGGEAQVTAAVDGRSGTATIHVMEPSDEEVAAVEVDPSETRIAVGRRDRLRANARSERGTLLEGRDVAWSSDNEDVATVNASGMVTGEAAGEATITATIDSVTGTASVTVTEDVEAVATVDVEPADTTIGVDEAVTLRAIARSENGDVLGGRDVSWSSSDGAIASVDENGLVTGESPGTVTIMATIDDISDSAAVTVSILPVDRVEITPPNPTVLVGGTAQLEAVPLSENGSPLEGRVAAWGSSDDAIATVDENGLVTGVAEGEATITATIEEVPGTTTLTVSLVPVARVEIEPTDTSVFVGDSVALDVAAFDADDNALEGRAASWASSDSAIAAVNNLGVVTGVAPGAVTITATIEDSTAIANVTVSLVPVAAVNVEPAQASMVAGETVQLSATPTDENGETLEDREAPAWSSSDDAVATVDNNGLVTGVAPGEATITATIEGADGAATVTVDLVPVADVDVTPTEASLVVDETVQLAATPIDEDGETLEDREAAAWSSSDDAIATVDTNGLVTGVAPGEATITATIEGADGAATITVSLVPVDSVEVAPSDTSVFVGQTVQLAATPLDDVAQPLEDREAATWESSDNTIATVDGDGVVTGVKAGTAAITATIEGVDGTATVTVELVPVAGVEVTPIEPSIFIAETVQLSATPLDDDGEPLEEREAATWLSSNSAIATVNNNGLVTGILPGRATIRATIEGVDGTATVTVALVPVSAVNVEPAEVSVFVDETVPLNATPLDEDGEPLGDREAPAWASSNNAIATVGGNGLATGIAPGQARITATIEDVEGTANVTVEPVPVKAVTVSPSTTTLLLGQDSAQYHATLLGPGNTTLPATGRRIGWGRTTPGDPASPCPGMSGSGPAQVTINPLPDDATTAIAILTNARPLSVSNVIIWAEADGKVGCATLRIALSLS